VLRLLEIPEEGKHRKDQWEDNKFEEDADYLKWVDEQAREGRE